MTRKVPTKAKKRRTHGDKGAVATDVAVPESTHNSADECRGPAVWKVAVMLSYLLITRVLEQAGCKRRSGGAKQKTMGCK